MGDDVDQVLGANPKLGFIIFMLNLALLLPVTLVSGSSSGCRAVFPAPDLGGAQGLAPGRQIKPFAPFMILVVIPFLVSRVARMWLPGLIAFKEKHIPVISKLTMFGIVFYLFSLSTSQLLFSVSLSAALVAVVATAAFYGVAFTAARFLTENDARGGRSIGILRRAISRWRLSWRCSRLRPMGRRSFCR